MSALRLILGFKKENFTHCNLLALLYSTLAKKIKGIVILME